MTKNTSSKKSKLPLYLSLLFVAILVVCYFIIPSVNDFFNEAWNVLTSDDEARVKKWVEGFGWLGPIVIILAMILQMFLLVIPTILLMLVAILAYGPLWGSILIFVAVLIASSVGYMIGKYMGSSLIERLLGEKTTKKVISFIEDYGFWAVVITRINPFLSNDAISFVAGILKMNFLKFISATAVGITPLILLIALTGQNIDSLKNGLLWGSIGSLIIFGVYIWWDKNRRPNKK
ncbi:MAG: TVP38/TMEM64 family protein [Aequorivita sp.]